MNDGKRKIIGSIIGLIVFIICIASLTLAFYRWRSPDKDVDVGLHEGGIKYVYSNNNILTSNSLAPVTTYTNVSSSLLYTDYTATNMTNSDSYKMTAILHINSISSGLQSNSFKWVLLEGNGTNYTNVVKEGNFSNAVVGDNEIDLNIYITPGANKNYRFVMYIDGNVQNNPSSGSIDAELELCDQVVPIINVTLECPIAAQGQEGTHMIYERYGKGIFKDSGATTTEMKTNANPITVPGKPGYVFLGYYNQTQSTAYNGTCNGTKLIENSGYINSAFTNTLYPSDTTLYCCMKYNNYTITLNRNGGTADSNPTSLSVTYNTSTLSPSSLTSLPKKEYTISYNMNNTNITAPSSPTKAQWSFNGWYAGTDSGDKVINNTTNLQLQQNAKKDANTQYTATNNNTWVYSGNATLYAHWSGGTITLPALSKPGYTCKWAKGSADGTKFNPSSQSDAITANTTFYATCVANIYKINLNSQGADNHGTTAVWYQYKTTKVVNGTTCYYYTSSNLADNTCLPSGYIITKPTKAGYTFDGYYSGENGTGTQYVNSSGGFINNIYQKLPSEINSSYTNEITLYYNLTVNELVFGDKTVTKTYSASQQTETNGVDAATNGSGTYTYAITAGNSNNYFSLEGRNIKIAASTPANTTGYQITITATDSNTHATKSATYTIKINKKALSLGTHSAIYNGTTSYSRTFSTGEGSETLVLTYKPYAKTAAAYTYATSAASGKYTVTMANGTGTATNYSISAGGTFTINKKALDITAYTTNWVNGATTYARNSYSTGVNS
ncbi:MAG: hypothetical protein IKF19_04765, partial [Bacilli bacterium]|nr:hypothetical protein [Bacilli bacterium]